MPVSGLGRVLYYVRQDIHCDLSQLLKFNMDAGQLRFIWFNKIG